MLKICQWGVRFFSVPAKTSPAIGNPVRPATGGMAEVNQNPKFLYLPSGEEQAVSMKAQSRVKGNSDQAMISQLLHGYLQAALHRMAEKSRLSCRVTTFPLNHQRHFFSTLRHWTTSKHKALKTMHLHSAFWLGETPKELGQEIFGKLQSNAATIYGRKLLFVLEDASITKQGDCFGTGSLAIVLASGVDRRVLLENALRCGTPVIAPTFPLLGLEDSALVRGVSATLQSQWASVKTEIGATPALALPLNISPDEAESIKLAFGDDHGQSDNSVVLAPFGLDHLSVRRGRKIFAPLWQSMGNLPRWRQNFENVILLSPVTPLDVSTTSEPILLRQAMMTADLLRMAAKAAGPEPTRHSFVAAFDKLHIESSYWPPLDYRRHRLTGSEAVNRIEVK